MPTQKHLCRLRSTSVSPIEISRREATNGRDTQVGRQRQILKSFVMSFSKFLFKGMKGPKSPAARPPPLLLLGGPWANMGSGSRVVG